MTAAVQAGDVVDAPRQPGRRTRIAYLAHGVHGRLDGVRAKILSQASTWAKLDPSVEVGLFVRCEAGAEPDWRGQPHVVKVRSSRAGIPGRLVERELLSVEAARWRPDVVYLRYSTVSPSVVLLAGSVPTIVELNTLDLSELRMRSKLRYQWAQATRDRLLQRVRGLVVVAREIADQPSVREVDVPKVVIPNSIDLTKYVPLPPAQNATPRLAFLGAPHSPWHGVDKIVRVARQFPTWEFDLIGPGPDELEGDVPNVHAHGLLDAAAYLPILKRADVAIGALALHRLDLSEASPLKVAEYLAYGIPVITGYRDTRFPAGAPFLLELPNADDNVESSFERIETFVRTWMGRRVERDAVTPIDSGVIERRRLEFILEMLPVRARHAIA